MEKKINLYQQSVIYQKDICVLDYALVYHIYSNSADTLYYIRSLAKNLTILFLNLHMYDCTHLL